MGDNAQFVTVTQSILYKEVNIDPLEVFVYGVYFKNGSTFTSVYREVNQDPL